jgi:hypothetical protein
MELVRWAESTAVIISLIYSMGEVPKMFKFYQQAAAL